MTVADQKKHITSSERGDRSEMDEATRVSLNITDEELHLHMKVLQLLYPQKKLHINKLVKGTYNIFTRYLVQSHIEDYNSFLNVYIKNMPQHIPPIEFSPKLNHYGLADVAKKKINSVKFFVSDIKIKKPVILGENLETAIKKDYPYLCKIAGRNYEGEIVVTLNRVCNGEVFSTSLSCGYMPIMVLSDKCNLCGLTKEELVQKGEDESVLGGYFVVSGRLRIIRFITSRKFNTCMVMNKGKRYAYMLCLLKDNTVVLNNLLQKENDTYVHISRYYGNVILMDFHILAMCLSPIKSKTYIINKLKAGITNENVMKYIEQYVNTSFINADMNDRELIEDCYLGYLGKYVRFRTGVLRFLRGTVQQKAKQYLKFCVFPHLDNNAEKFEALCFMFKMLILNKFKLIETNEMDSLEFQGVATPSHFISGVLKDQIMNALNIFAYRYQDMYIKTLNKKFEQFKTQLIDISTKYKNYIEDELKELKQQEKKTEREKERNENTEVNSESKKETQVSDNGREIPSSITASSVETLKKQHLQQMKEQYLSEKEKLFDSINTCVTSMFEEDASMANGIYAFVAIGVAIQFFFKTGTITSKSAGCVQSTGCVINADEINNLRMLTNFRALHRGSVFVNMKTLGPRKLKGESWGFICPVQTPDGAPCGLLNHLTQLTHVHTEASNECHKLNIKIFLRHLGIQVNVDDSSGIYNVQEGQTIPIIVDSVPITYISPEHFKRTYYKLLYAKNKNLYNLKASFEIIAHFKESALMDAIYINTTPGTLLRPVFNIKMKTIEFVTPSSQPYMSIALNYEELKKSKKIRSFFKKKKKEMGELAKKFTSSERMKLTLEQQYILYLKEQKREEKTQQSAKTEVVDNNVRGYAEKYTNGTPLQKNMNLNREKEVFENDTDSRNSSDYESDESDELSDISELSQTDLEEIDLYEQIPEKYEYMELKETSFLSLVAALTPFSDHNQSPRNIYQCQMLKQTMGLQCLNTLYAFTEKIYRIITPQYPLVVTRDYELYGMDNYPTGTNAVVAILSYTGFDMEDALILNKSSVDRGIFQCSVYKTERINLIKDFENPNIVFGNNERYELGNIMENSETDKTNSMNTNRGAKTSIEMDGFPSIQQTVDADSFLFSYIDTKTALTSYEKYGKSGTYFIDTIGVATDENNHQFSTIKLRSHRKPRIGDKFASRHGQKGVVSILFPHEDMPFSESGIVPDIIFNPHGIPSRMTIGMLIESICGKAASMYAKRIDATPFRKYLKQKSVNNEWVDNGGLRGYLAANEQRQKEDSKKNSDRQQENRSNNQFSNQHNKNMKSSKPIFDDKIDYFAKLLLNKGYDYYGTECLYSGVYGVPMQAHIFMGVIYYQRLRHMVYDKAQARRLGPVCNLTHQPVKGKKRHGGMRMGEMERDGMISHGCSFTISERFLYSSDLHECFVCPKCGLILSPILQYNVNGQVKKGRSIGGTKRMAICKACNVSCNLILIPYVLRYLMNELICLNVVIRLNVKTVEQLLNIAK